MKMLRKIQRLEERNRNLLRKQGMIEALLIVKTKGVKALQKIIEEDSKRLGKSK